jgi:RNA polymerase sigma factor (sigma-70 family)
VSFKPLPDYELEQLDDERLISYVRDARDGARLDMARRGLAILVYGYERNVKLRLRMKVPPGAVEDLAHDALVRAIGAAFDGTSVGEFRAWLNVIVDRAAVDFYRRRERRPVEQLLPSEHGGDEDVWQQEPSVESDAGAVEVQLVIDEVLATFNDTHRQVIQLHVFDGLTAAEVCGRIEGMSENNVAQIATRFRLRLRAQLEAEGAA